MTERRTQSSSYLFKLGNHAADIRSPGALGAAPPDGRVHECKRALVEGENETEIVEVRRRWERATEPEASEQGS